MAWVRELGIYGLLSRPYYSYGGISRPVALEEVPDCYIDAVQAIPNKAAAEWTLDLHIFVRNCGVEDCVIQATSKLEGAQYTFESQVVPAGGMTTFSGRMTCPDVLTYKQKCPTLYLLSTQIMRSGEVTPLDDLVERVGFRDVHVEKDRIFLNDEPLFIKGFNRHEDHPDHGCALPVEAMARDLALLRDMGANAVRTSHYPNDPRFLDLCDELGILVWEENHARGLSEEQMQNPNFRAQCSACIEEMVSRDINHPSIIIWGILNECASNTPCGRDCYAEQFAQLRTLDSSRPISFATCHHHSDLCLDMADIVSVNLYPEWYENAAPGDLLESLHQWIRKECAGAEKPFLATEIGAGALYGYRSPARVKWSEERQADILAVQWEAVLSDARGSGGFVWQFCDVRVSEEWFQGRPRCMNNKGVVDEHRRPKLAYEVVKRLFGHQRAGGGA